MRKIKIPNKDVINCLDNKIYSIKDRIITFYEVNNISANIKNVFYLIEEFEDKYKTEINTLFSVRDSYANELKFFGDKNTFFDLKIKRCICENYKVKPSKVRNNTTLEDEIKEALNAIFNKKIECYKMNNLLYKCYIKELYS